MLLNAKIGSVTKGSTMDLQLIWDLFANFIEAAAILEVEHDLIDRVKQAKEKLFPLQVGKQGQLQEWAKDYEDGDPNHRHVSHLYGLYPGTQITDGAFLDAARQTLNIRDDAGTGWSLGWKMNLWARLKDGERVRNLLDRLFNIVETSYEDSLSGGIYSNLLGAHPPFQIDGNFGYTAGVVEMIMQSHKGYVELLPALPSTWQTGFLTGIRARGGFELDVTWRSRKMVSLNVVSKTDRTFHLKHDDVLTIENNSGVEQTIVPINGIISLKLKRLEKYLFKFSGFKR